MKKLLFILIFVPFALFGQENFHSSCFLDYYPSELQNGMSHFYSFCGNTNDLINGVNGINHGAQFISNRFGFENSAISFDGNDYVELNNTYYQGETNKLGLEWVRPIRFF